jgi:radical SAM protein with 4Fe4S-binding SPASM domain
MDKKSKETGNKTKEGKSNKSVLYVVVGIAVIIVIAAAIAGFSNYSKSYVASVGKEKISVDEYKFFLEQEKNNMLNIAGNPDPETFWDTTITGGEKAIDIAKKKALENIRELKIQLMKTKEQKISLDKSETENIEKGIESIITQYGGKSAADAAYREIYGIGINEFKEIYKDYVLINKLVQKEMESIEANGGVYPCDFYVLDKWYLGNIKDTGFGELSSSPKAIEFVESSKHIDPECPNCKWYSLCRGGCRRNREPFIDGKPALNYFCSSYKEFFEYAVPKLYEIAYSIKSNSRSHF